MHEIIHLSLSAQANHLTTHFYNAQDSYFVYGGNEVSHVDPAVLFKTGMSTDKRTTTFTPRALIWDMRGGYGSLKKTNILYPGALDNLDISSNTEVWNQGQKPLQTLKEPQVSLNDYQQALDSGEKVVETAAKLTPQNTKYWSDYVNIFYNPKSFHQLPNWEYDPDQFPQGRLRGETSVDGRKFIDYETGVSEFKDMNVTSEDSYLDNVFRPALEECDSLSGLTISTEADSAWGGFSARILEELREEYIPKKAVFVWGLYDQSINADIDHTSSAKNVKQSRMQILSRIKTTTALARDSTLFFPVSKPNVPVSVLKDYDSASNWHSAALLNLPFETISVLSSMRGEKRVSMQTLADNLQDGSTRNIVSNIESAIIGPLTKMEQGRKKHVFDFSGSVFQSKEQHFFTKLGTIRPPSVSTQLKNTSLDLDMDKYMLWEDMFKGSQLQTDGTAQSGLHQINCPQSFSLQKSFPSKALDIDLEDSVYVGVGMTSAPRKALKDMNTFVSKFVRTADEGRDELKEDTSTMAELYEWGWEGSEEDEDDL